MGSDWDIEFEEQEIHDRRQERLAAEAKEKSNLLAEVDRLRADLDILRAQLPEGMRHSTILFKQCEKGHGWLTATNWVQVPCPTCERDKLQAFKDWVHAYLDNAGVPHHPPGTHSAAGCRIGDRMDWLMDLARELAAALHASAESYGGTRYDVDLLARAGAAGLLPKP